MPDIDSNNTGTYGTYTGFEIAVIGMAGRFPGASTIDIFWDNLKNGVESVSFFSDEELLSAGVDERLVGHPDYVKAAAVIRGKEYFDSRFFGYLPDEARVMDPQMRLFHQCVWEALEDAGYNPYDYEGAIGLYAGSGSSFDWEAYSRLSGIGTSIDDLSASQLRDRTSLATVISYKLNLKGPVFTLHTACSTSLAAIHLACQGLICGDCDIAVAGGVSLRHSSQKGYLYREGLIISPDGHCRAFDAGAKGIVAGEGAAVTVLKPMDNAVKEGDNIHALVRGTYINNDGVRKLGYTAPSVEGQAEVIRNALSAASIEPETITYIETHGTGTALGDPIEVEALDHVFGAGKGKNKEKYCALGSLKTNVGHLDTAAGAAGFIKTVLALKHRRIPPNLHFNTPNPRIDFENSPFYVNTTLKKWETPGYPLRAGVSSFGIGGTNAHVILEECPSAYNKEASSSSRKYQLIVFSARTASALDRMTENLREYLKKNLSNPGNPDNLINPGLNLADAAYTLQTGRMVFPHRRMLVCSDCREAVEILSSPGLERVKSYTARTDKEDIPVVFMFSGQGAQYVDMGLELYRREPVFQKEMDRCFEILKSFPAYEYDLRDILYPAEGDGGRIDRSEILQPLLFIFEYALAKSIMHWGIAPDAMIGYSYGEYVSACLAGVFSLEDAIKISVLRGQLMKKLPAGAMLSVPLPEEELVPLLELHNELSLAVVNGPSCIVSGPEAAAAAFEKQMKEQKLLCLRVGMSIAGHSRLMDPILKEFEANFKKIKLDKPKIPYISNVSGTWIRDEEAVDPSYWSAQLRSTVRFGAGLQALLKRKYPKCLLVEVGPGKSLCNIVRQHPARTPDHLVINLIRSDNERVSDLYHLVDRLGRMWLYGVKIDWKQFYSEEKRRFISLPTYPFEKIKYPAEVNISKLISELRADQKVSQFKTGEREQETGIAITDADGVERPPLVTAYVEPSIPTEQALVKMWQTFFGVGGIGTADDFFELGGDSLKAMTLAAKIHQRFDVEVSLTGFFANSTIKDLARLIDASVKKEYAFIEPAEKKEYYPLTSAQKRLYILQQMVWESTAYNLPQFIPFGGNADREHLEKVFRKLIQRHESLRTSFHLVNEEPVQRVHPDVEFEIEYFLATEDTEVTIRPFDLSRAPLMRAGLVKTGDENYLLMVDMHHIISDGVSLNLLEKEFAALYRDPDTPLPELKIQYKDYSQWQGREEWQEAVKRQEEYWLKEFSGEIPVLNLPPDFQRPAVQSFEGSTLSFYLDGVETAQLKELAQKHDATLYMVLLAIFNILLAKLSGQDHIVVGTGVAGRRHPDLEHIIGMFVNTLALRSHSERNKTAAAYLEEVKEKTLSAFDNQEYPFEDLVERIDVSRDTSRNPLFDAMFILQTQAEFRGEIPIDTNTISHGGSAVSKFDITLNSIEMENGLLFVFEYCTGIFNVDTIERFARYLKRIISSVIRDPGQRLWEIDLLSPGEKERLLYDFNVTDDDYPVDKTLHQLFEEEVEKTPDRTAIVSKKEKMHIIYRVLNEKADQVAEFLREKGVLTDSIVAIMMNRSIEMIIGILGILKAGGAYMPIDPDYPQERIDFMLKDSGAKILLTNLSEGHHFRHSSNRFIDHHSGSLSYVIYTSGSTGRPKGTLTTHGNVVRVVKNSNYIDIKEDDRVLQWSNYAFDGSVFDIFAVLSNGAALLLVGKEETFDIDRLSRLIRREHITIFFVTTALFNTLVDLDVQCLKNVRKILFGGERVSVEHARKAVDFLGKGRIMHMYGPTETTVYASYYNINAIEESAFTIPIGRPISHTALYILDEHLRPQPVGVGGEIYIGGDGLASGYLNQPELTNEKFFGGSRGAIFQKSPPGRRRLYRTGDLARWLPGGDVEFLGRIDSQVKIRGFRVELGEIERLLLKHDRIKEVVVLFRGMHKDAKDRYLCAYVVPVENALGEITDTELKEYLLQMLPNYMIPSFFVRMDKMPLTPNGKIDTRALPVPGAAGTAEAAGNKAPHDEMEKKLVEIWTEILGRDGIGINDNFFALGGHSLKAAVLASRIHKEFHIRIPLAKIFAEPFIRQLAMYIKGSPEDKYASIQPVEWKEYYPLSSAQKRMYILQQMDINNVTYNIPVTIPIEGNIEKDCLENIFKMLINRHESFRTSFEMIDGQPVQRIHQDVIFEIEFYETQSLIGNFIRPFDLSQAPLLRVGLIHRHTPALTDYILMVDMHHIISDGVSLNLLEKEFALLYRDPDTPLPELKIQYKDYSQWQGREEWQEAVKRQEEYWLKEFSGEIPVLNLPPDFQRPAVQSFEGSTLSFYLGGMETAQLKELAQKHDATLYMVLLAIFNILLAKLSGQDHIVVGTGVAGRKHPDLEHIIGMFVNTLALRSYPERNKTAAAYLEEVKEKTLSAFDNQEYPFEDLVKRIDVSRDTSRNPLFDAMFILQTQAEFRGEIPADTNTISHGGSAVSKFDITLNSIEMENGLLFVFEYCTGIFNVDTIERFARYLKRIISSVIRGPGQRLWEIDLLSPEEREQLLYDFNDTYDDYPVDKPLHRLFEEEVEKAPDRTTIVGKKEKMHIIYRVLNEKANQVAEVLREKGVLADDIVGIMMERSIEMIAGILGILKAGGAYMPIEPDYPRERIDFMLKDSGAKILLTNLSEGHHFHHSSNRFIDHYSGSLAYVIYTSGSTGRPKGTLTTHRNVVRVVKNSNYIDIKEDDRVLQLSNYAFDGSVFDIFGVLSNGAALVLVEKEETFDIDRLSRLIRREHITIFFVTTALFNTLVDLDVQCLKNVRKILFGGERVSVEHTRKALDSLGKGRIMHMYGPTETTVYASYYNIDAIKESAFTIPIGRPISHTALYILDEHLRPQPVGVGGEIYIGGDGLARGYLNQPELTAEKFIEYRSYRTYRTYVSSKKIYRTGDLARWLPGGDVEFLGRIDSQVKIRGFRVELGEIERLLLKHDRIKEAVVLFRGTHKDAKDCYLCAYFVPVENALGEITDAELKEYLLQTLPQYMIPSFFVRIDKMPLTPNSKIDTRALPVAGAAGTAEVAGDKAPHDEMEKKLLEMWTEILGRDGIGINDNFFDLGGHSLKATILASRIHKELNRKIPLAEIFRYPTIHGLAVFLKKIGETDFRTIECIEEREFYQLSYNQKRLWFIHQLEPGTSAFNIPGNIALKKKVEEGAIKKIIRVLVKRHDSLRTGFKTVNGEPVQYILEDVHTDIAFRMVDISSSGEADPARRRQQIYNETARTPFDLAQAPLFRTVLVKLGPDFYELIFSIHHIISDGWSIELLKKEFRLLYETYKDREEIEPEPLEIQYTDFAYWQNRQVDSPVLREEPHRYWKNKLKDGIIPVKLQGAEAGKEGDRRGAGYRFWIGSNVKDRLTGLARTGNTSLFIVMYSIYILFLYRFSNREDIACSLIDAGRDHVSLQRIIGFFVNAVPTKIRIEENEPFADFLKRVHRDVMEALRYQGYPLEPVFEDLRMKYPEINLSFNMVNVLEFTADMELEPFEPYHIADFIDVKFDIEPYVSQYRNGLDIFLSYRKNMFKPDTIAYMMKEYTTLLKFFSANPVESFKDYRRTKKKRTIWNN